MHGALGVLAEAHLRFPVGSARHHWAIHAAHILHEWFLRRFDHVDSFFLTSSDLPTVDASPLGASTRAVKC